MIGRLTLPRSLIALRGSQIQAAKEMIYLDAQIQTAEAKLFSTIPDDEEIASIDRPATGEGSNQDTTQCRLNRDDISSMRSSRSGAEQSDESHSSMRVTA